MIMVKDIYISRHDIKKIHFEGDGNFCFMCITYRYDDDNPIKIEVEAFGEYKELADGICNSVNMLEG